MSTYNYTRIRPVDLLEVAGDQGGTTTLADAISAIQSNKGLTHDCPKCVVEGTPTGWITVPPSLRVICDLCVGNLKTSVQYIADTNSSQFVALIIGGPNTVLVGDTITLTPSVAGGVWSSADDAKATVDADTGVVTGTGAGTVTITYTLNTIPVTYDITVTVPL